MKPLPYSNFYCEHCGEKREDEESNVVLYNGRFVREGNTAVVKPDTAEWRHVCNDCCSDNDVVLWCAISNIEFLCSEFSYTYVDDPFGDYVLDGVLDVMGYEYDDEKDAYIQKEQAMAKYVDFYWKLEDGKRSGVLQVEDGDEVPMAAGLEKKIYHRIEEAGADRGDPHVVNVYTRLQLIDEGILPPDYTL